MLDRGLLLRHCLTHGRQRREGAVSGTWRDTAFGAALLFGIMFLLVALEARDGTLLIAGAALVGCGLAGAR